MGGRLFGEFEGIRWGLPAKSVWLDRANGRAAAEGCRLLKHATYGIVLMGLVERIARL